MYLQLLRFNWQAGWIHLGIFGFFVAGLNFLFIRNPGKSEGDMSTLSRADVTRILPRVSCRQFLGSLHLWLIGCSYLLIGFTVLVSFTFLGVYAAEELHLSYTMATRFFTIIAVAGMAGKLSLGVLSDRWGRIRVIMMSGCLLGLGCWGIANVPDLLLKFFPLSSSALVLAQCGRFMQLRLWIFSQNPLLEVSWGGGLFSWDSAPSSPRLSVAGV